jgi:hypothetical protein
MCQFFVLLVTRDNVQKCDIAIESVTRAHSDFLCEMWAVCCVAHWYILVVRKEIPIVVQFEESELSLADDEKSR